MRIAHNISGLNTLNKMQQSNKKVENGLEKLSSGLRINKAADDAAGLAISEKMRAQIRGLEQAEQNIDNGISLIKVADGALDVVMDPHLIRLRELAVQAANDTLSTSDRQAIQQEINQIKEAVDQIANDTEFNTIKLLNGTNPLTQANTGGNSSYNFENVLRTPPVGSNGSFQFGTNEGYPTTTADDNQTLVYGSGGTSRPAARIDDTSYYLIGDTSISPTVEENGVYKTVYTIPDKNVEVTQLVSTVEDKYEIKYTIKNNDAANHSIGFQYHLDTKLGDDDAAPFIVDGNQIDTQTVYTGDSIPSDFTVYNQSTGSGGNAEFQAFGQMKGEGIIEEPSKVAIGRYNAVADWDFNSNTGSVGDSGYSVRWDPRGITSGNSFSVNTFYGQSVPPTIESPAAVTEAGPYDLLLQVGPNTGDQFKVQLSDIRTSELEIENLDVLTSGSAQAAIGKADKAMGKVISERTKYGAYQNALEHTRTNVSNASTILTATESQIRDLDMAKGIMKLTKNQIILQSSQAMFSTTNQATQSVLQFLK